MSSKKSRIFTILLTICFVLSLCFAMSACDKSVGELKSDIGITVEGEFEKGAQLIADIIEKSDENWQIVIDAIKDCEYKKDGDVSVFDISVVKDGGKVQPGGKVKITLPAPFVSESGYVVFHIKDDNFVETLTTTYADGKITFETDSFSYFVVAAVLTNEKPPVAPSLRLDGANAGFTEGKATYIIGNEFPPKPENVLVIYVTADGEEYLEKDRYTIDLGGLDFTKEGTYTVTYTYKDDNSLKATLTIQVVEPEFAFSAIVGNGAGSILYGGEEMPNGYYGEHKAGEQITLEAAAKSGYEFVGWFTRDNDPQLISSSSQYTFTAQRKETSVQAVFEPVVTSLRLDGVNAGFSDGKATYVIGNEFVPKPENVAVFGVTLEGETPLDADQYSVDLGGLDFTVEGSYIITFSYEKDASIKATLTVNVVSADSINLSMSGSSSRSAYYTGGCAPRIAKSEILNNGEPCDLDALGLVWEWRDMSGAVVSAVYDTTWDRETLFPTPAKAGKYQFVICSETDGVKTDLLVTEHEIIERKVSLVTDSSDIGTYEYYVPVAKVEIDGSARYYAMTMPGTLSNPSAKLPAIEVTPDADGNFMIGGEKEFIFSVYDSGKRMGDTVLYNIRIGGDYSTKMGALSLNGSTGNIAYDNSYYAGEFAADFVFNSDGSVGIDSAYEGGRLGFAYTEEDGYYFTASKTDEATYYPVYLYQTYVAPPTEQYEYIGGDLSKTYDGAPVSVDPYKDFVIRTENGEDWSVLSKNGTGRFAWGTGKGEDLQEMTDDGSGRLVGPSEVGEYCIVFQIKLKDDTWQTVGYGPLVYFTITAQ